MEAESNNDFQIVFSEAPQSNDTIRCHLSPEISAVDMEIRWFKETDCVLFYKNRHLIEGMGYEGRVSLCNELKRGNVSLQLKDVRESDVGDYLCQVTSGKRTKEITEALKIHKDQTEMLPSTSSLRSEKIDKKWTDEEKMKMANSALLAVFCNLEKIDRQNTEDQSTKKLTQTEEDDMQQEDFEILGLPGNPVTEMDTSKPEEQDIKSEIEMTPLDNQQPGCSDQNLLDNGFTTKCFTNSEPGQIQCQARESSNKSNRKNEGESQQVETKSQRKEHRRSTNGVKVFSILTGKTNNCEKKFIDILGNKIGNLRECQTEDESDIILVFCPIVSRAGTDIDAALNKFPYSTDTKLAVLVVLHHTFDPEKITTDSSRYVTRKNFLTADLLFYEDTGLLECQKNSDAYDKVVKWLIQQGSEIGISISPFQSRNKSFDFKIPSFSWAKNTETPGHNIQQRTSTSSCSVNYFLSVTGDAQKHHMHFIKVLQKQMSLKEVFTLKESDVILLFCPEITEYGKKTDKPVILISLYDTTNPGSVQNISEFGMRRKFLPVDCIFVKGTGLLDCKTNRKEISDVSNCLQQIR